MESDGFTQPTVTEDDPFAGSDFGDFDQTPPQAPPESPAPAEAIPTVNREGEPVAPPSGLPTLTPEQQAAEGAAYREATGEPKPPSPEELAEAMEPSDPMAGKTMTELVAENGGVEPESSHVPQDGASVESQEGEAAPEQSGPQIEQPVQPEPEAAAEKVEAALQPDDSSPAAPDEEEEAPAPEERKTKGRVTHRRYIILRVTAADKFERLYWYEGKDGSVVPRGQGKKQGVTLQRSTEDALRFAFGVVGSPQDGITLVPVAELYFQPRRVRPKPPAPERQALEIS